MKRISSDLFLVVLAICLCVGFSSYLGQFFGALHEKVDIDLSLAHLPQYTFFSFARGLAAYVLSLIFAVAVGFLAAKDKFAERVLIPLIDILQSIPFLGFLPGFVLLFMAMFPRSNMGLELAAILLMFTAQVWNMVFSVYQSIRTVPLEKSECAAVYRFSASQRLRWIELPCCAQSLVWNSIMSMAGAWFFLMVNEAFTLRGRDFRLPGLGSYMSVAAAKEDFPAMAGAIVAMVLLIALINQLMWSPLVSWSQKFRIEESNAQPQIDSWFLTILRNSYFISFIRAKFQRLGKWVQDRKNNTKKRVNFHLTIKTLSKIVVLALLVLLAIAAVYVFNLLKNVTVDQWLHLGKMLGFTFARVVVCVLISVAIMVPLGIAICATEKRARVLQPILQIAVSFPATLLYPIFILIFVVLKIPLGIGSVVLMLMGTQWYVLFNVIAGAKGIPSDLKEMTSSFQFSGQHRFFSLQLPAIVPYLITGVVAASGGAWNASVVAEYVAYKHRIWATPGIGSAISMAAQNNDYPLLAASILVMMVVVAIINYQVWLRLYHYSEKRFALNV
jgi:NitT/TauT family transport system permease protein